MDYYVHKVIREGEERVLLRRQAEARWLREARELRDSSRAQPARGTLAMRLVTLVSRWRTRDVPGVAPGRVKANITAATRLVAPVAALAIGELDGATIGTAAVGAALIFAGRLELTNANCRLPDGSLGRIAIDRVSEEDWSAVCVPAAQEEPASALQSPDPSSR